MLFHVTMTHTPQECPGYSDNLLDFTGAVENLRTFGKEWKVKTHFFVWNSLEHVGFALLEADSLNAITRYINSLSIKQTCKVTPVEHLQDVMIIARETMVRT